MEVEGITELPSESPLTEGIFIHVLKGAASNDPQQIRTSTTQLENWQTKPGYHGFLQAAFRDKYLPWEVRYLAIIQLRNGIDKYWRKSASNEIPTAEKEQIRSQLLTSGLEEVDSRLALHNALVVAKIARYDFPARWPDLLNHLKEAIRLYSTPDASGGMPYQLSRALLMLLRVTKEVSMVRIGPARNNLKYAAPELIQLIADLYFNTFQPDFIRQVLQSGEGHLALQSRLEQSLLSMKILRRLAVSLTDRPREDGEVAKLWLNSLSTFRAAIDIAVSTGLGGQDETQSALALLIRRNLTQVAKLHVNMAKNHATDFSMLQSDDLEVIRTHWHIITLLGQHYAIQAGYPPVTKVTQSVNDFDESQTTLMDKLGHQSLVLMRACAKMVSGSPTSIRYRSSDEKEEDNKASNRIKNIFFTADTILELINHIVMELFLFQPSDLREWEEEPDEWEKREELGSEDFEFAVKPCAEKLLLDLVIKHKDLAAQRLTTMLATVTAPGFSALLQKDAVYGAIGIAASSISSKLDFDTLLNSNLVQEVQVRDPQYKILRRRIAMLLGKWASVRLAKESRPLVYQIFHHLLNPQDEINDQVVRVTAGRQLRDAVDAWEFDAEQFLPFVDEILASLMSLIEEVELQETRLALLNTISVITERMEHRITPFAKRIIDILPPLWDQSGEEHLMKQAILGLLSRLLLSMRETGVEFHSLTFPIIRDIVQPESPLAIFLLEDCLELWSTVLQNTPDPPSPSDVNPDLISLVEFLIPLLAQDTHNLEKCMEITELYIKLVPTTMLSETVFPAVLNSLEPKLGSLKAGHNGYVTNVVEMGLIQAQRLGGVQGTQHIVSYMLTTSFFDGLIIGLKESWEAHQTSGPKAVHTMVQGIVETDYLSLLARIGVSSPQLLIDALQAAPAAQTKPEKLALPSTVVGIDATLHWFLDEWFSHAEDGVGDPAKRKLLTMALTRLLELHQPWILSRMQSLMNLWTTAISDLTDEDRERTVDYLVWDDDYPAGADHDTKTTPDAKRSVELEREDPVHKVNLIELVRTTLRECVQRCGSEQAFQDEVLVNVDKEVIQAFQALAVM